MPPYKLYFVCRDCPFEFTDWQIRGYHKAENHARKQRHMLTATREIRRHGYSGSETSYIRPPKQQV